MTPELEALAGQEARTIASLSKLERAWLKRRFCGWCEAPALGSHCYAQSGNHVLPVIEGVRDKPETIDLGPPCDMDQRRAEALELYKPRTPTQNHKGPHDE